MLAEVVALHDGDIPAAARALGINEPAFRQRLRRAGIKREPGWTSVPNLASDALTESLAIGTVELVVELESTRDALVRAEVQIGQLSTGTPVEPHPTSQEAVIDRLAAKIVEMATEIERLRGMLRDGRTLTE